MKRLKVDSEKAHTLLMGYLQAVICLLRHSVNKHIQEAGAERTLNYSTIGNIILKIKLKLKITKKPNKYGHVWEGWGVQSLVFRCYSRELVRGMSRASLCCAGFVLAQPEPYGMCSGACTRLYEL